MATYFWQHLKILGYTVTEDRFKSIDFIDLAPMHRFPGMILHCQYTYVTKNFILH